MGKAVVYFTYGKNVFLFREDIPTSTSQVGSYLVQMENVGTCGDLASSPNTPVLRFGSEQKQPTFWT